jgi:bifunctional non-homologous end joining protein LigD
MAFDLIYFDGHDLRGLEHSSRRHLLEELLEGKDGAIRLSEMIDADPDMLLEHACQLGLEGIVGKHRDSGYRSGRTGDWIKCKCVQSEAFLVVGYEPPRGLAGNFASLLLAAYSGDTLTYVGSVGTGFTQDQIAALRTTLDKLTWRRKLPPVDYVATSPHSEMSNTLRSFRKQMRETWPEKSGRRFIFLEARCAICTS